jgi:predicted phosphate transport protein (TIGR00153 family)
MVLICCRELTGGWICMVRLVPRDTKFFDMFADMATNLCDGARLLKSIFDDYQNVEVRVQNLKDLEHRGDEMTHAVMVKLNKTFITPFDREDIHALATAMDDVLDFIYAAGERLVMYRIQNVPAAASELASVIIRQTEQLQKAVSSLDKHDNVLQICVEINRLENDADHIARTALAALFDREKDPITLIKIKELIEFLETATDKAEDAANVLETVVLKSA